VYAEAYRNWADSAPAAVIPHGRRLDVLGHAGNDGEWSEVVFFGERYFVRTEDLHLDVR